MSLGCGLMATKKKKFEDHTEFWEIVVDQFNYLTLYKKF